MFLFAIESTLHKLFIWLKFWVFIMLATSLFSRSIFPKSQTFQSSTNQWSNFTGQKIIPRSFNAEQNFPIESKSKSYIGKCRWFKSLFFNSIHTWNICSMLNYSLNNLLTVYWSLSLHAFSFAFCATYFSFTWDHFSRSLVVQVSKHVPVKK